jgi:preprotein translocase subunit SecB
MSDTSTDSGNPAAEENDRTFVLKKVYLKDLSYEEPSSPEGLLVEEKKPTIVLNVRLGSGPVSNGLTEVGLRIMLKALSGDMVCFILEFDQAGLFSIHGYSDEEREKLIRSNCPAAIYPFARETIWSVIGKGGFKAIMLQAINFDALMEEVLAEGARFVRYE